MIGAMLAAVVGLGVAGDVKSEGAFGFPQAAAKVVCDTPELRVSVCNDSEHLYVQAVLWKDEDNTNGETEDGRAIGDCADVVIDANADGKRTAKVDRVYSLSPWPSKPGLWYSVVQGENMFSALTGDSKGRGCVSYVAEADGHRVRVDSFLLPLEEIGRRPGQEVRLAYWGYSPHPEMTVNSVGYSAKGRYYSHGLPWKDFFAYTLAEKGPAIDAQKAPEGRGTIAVEKKPIKPFPDLGKAPPEVQAGAWLNWGEEKPPSLASLEGKVVVVEFWATWCGPCVEGIPHLNEVYEKHAKDGLVILSLTDQNKEYVEKFMAQRPMKYTVGVRSNTAQEYGVQGIPHAFIIGRDGVLRWHGHPGEGELEPELEKALK